MKKLVALLMCILASCTATAPATATQYQNEPTLNTDRN
jgi:hypothetical protein